jgi:transcriptional regulator with XRE-family HTH domain
MEMRSNQSIGEIIRYFRLLKNYSQKELSDLLNVTESAVSAWERGLSKPGVDIAMRLASEMNMHLEDFYFVPVNQIFSQNYQLFETVKLQRGYFEFNHISVDLNQRTFELAYSLTGLTVDETYINNEIKLILKTSGEELPSQRVKPIEKTYVRPQISPELENVPLEAARFNVTENFSLSTADDIQLILIENGSTFIYQLSKASIELLNQLNNGTQSIIDIPKTSIDELTSVFLFLTKNSPELIQNQFKRFVTS